MDDTTNENGVDHAPSELSVSVIVVSYNSAGVIAECLEPIAGQDDFEIIVWDNASSDDTVQLVRSDFPSVAITECSKNLGFAAAINKAAIHVRGKYILLLNPDAVITADAVRLLVLDAESDPSVGILAPLVVQPQGRLKIMEVGRTPTVWRVLMHFSGLSRLSGHVPALEGFYLLARHQPLSRDVDWVSGGCMLIRRIQWEQAGGLTERWFMYAEDLEYCLRARSAGWRVRINSAVLATHLMGGSSNSSSTPDVPSFSTIWLTNLFDLYKTYLAANVVEVVIWKLIVCGGMALRSLAKLSTAVSHRSEVRRADLAESRRFRAYANALWREPIARPKRAGG